MLEAKKDRSEELTGKILSLEIFKWIDSNLLDYNNGDIKNFLHTLCPKHIDKIDEVITRQSIDKKKLKEIIVNSIYNELNAVLRPDHNIITSLNAISVNGRYVIRANINPDDQSVDRIVPSNAEFSYSPKKNIYSFIGSNRELQILHNDNSGEIFIDHFAKNVKQEITDDNLKKSAKECLIFLTSVSLVELEMYYQIFTQSITQEKEGELPSTKTIISAMQQAQEFVEQMRNKEKENKKEEDKKNDNKNIKIIIEGKTAGIKNNTKNTGFNNNNSWKNWFKTTPPFRECYNCCCGGDNEVESNQIVIGNI